LRPFRPRAGASGSTTFLTDGGFSHVVLDGLLAFSECATPARV
jgi:hypothetical protein